MKDTVVPLQFPITNMKTGKEIHEIIIYKGTPVYIGMGATNRSTALWGPDAAEFKPERWMGHQAHESTVKQIKTPGIFSNMYETISYPESNIFDIIKLHRMTFLGGGRGCLYVRV